MKKSIFTLLIILAIFIAPDSVFAADFRGGNEIFLSEMEEINENLYIGAGSVDIEVNVNGDLSVASGDSVIKGNTTGDLIVVGGDIRYEGNVEGDVRIIGGNISIKGSVEGELVVIGGNIFLEKGTVIKGDTLLLGGVVTVESDSEKALKILGGNVILNANINGLVEITTQNLTLGNDAKINNLLSYFSPDKLDQEVGSQINGEVSYNQINSLGDNGLVKQTVLSFINFWILLRFITTLLLAFLLVYIFKVFSQKTADFALDSFGTSIVIGLVTLFVTPVISVVLFASLIAMPISILLTLSLIFIIVISSAISGIILGALVKKVIKKDEHTEVSFQTATLGVVLLSIVKFVPFLGDMISLLFFIVAIGAVSHYIYMNIRWRTDY